MKICRKCNVEKSESEFYKNSRYRDGLNSACKECLIAVSRKWQKQNPGRYAYLLARHQAKINGQAMPLEYSYPVKASVDECQLCGEETALVYDHDHVHGAFRGMICMPCNLRMANVEREFDWYQAAIKHIKKARATL